MTTLEHAIIAFAGWIWGVPILVLLLGGGTFFLIYSRLLPYRHFGHALRVLSGRYDKARDPGDLTHFQALSSALSGTLGLGNIAGVAVAIQIGGPGAVFWMWMTALLGVATKFFTCTLGVMYRGRDSLGHIQGGPMYVITEGLGKRWRPLAVWFAIAGLFGTLPVFQMNQLTQVVRDVLLGDSAWVAAHPTVFNAGFGLAAALVVAAVIFGGIRRIGAVSARLVPLMVGVYLVAALWTLATHAGAVPEAFLLIVIDAWTGQAAAGGVFGAVLVAGVRRGAFSNEAGIGTEVMAHGAAKTREPVREGLVAMLGPVIDTLIVCSCTALVILVTGVWQGSDANGVTLTAQAFEQAMPGVGTALLTVVVFFLAISTLFTYWYYGAKCLGFLIGAERQAMYRYIYVILAVIGAMASLDAVIALIDGMYALMAVPTMIASLLLAPRVMAAVEDYFRRQSAAAGRT